jgi:acetyl esterase/lipase
MMEFHMNDSGLTLPQRCIPVPSTISPEAQKFLSTPLHRLAAPAPPADTEAWRSYLARRDQELQAMLAPLEAYFPAKIAAGRAGAATLYEITPDAVPAHYKNCAILYFHGGAYVIGGGRSAALMALPFAAATGCKAYACDYRMPPDHPYPAAVDDAVAAYRQVLGHVKPGDLAVVGSSAGGGLAAAAVLKIRDLGLPLPAAVVLGSPEVDLTESGDTFQTNCGIDNVLGSLAEVNALYVGGHDLRDPYLSPVFGDFSKGFPPTMLLSGTRDLFLSNTVILHRALRRANIEAELHVFEAMPHGGFRGAPEDQEAMAEQVRFLQAHLAMK